MDQVSGCDVYNVATCCGGRMTSVASFAPGFFAQPTRGKSEVKTRRPSLAIAEKVLSVANDVKPVLQPPPTTA